MSDDKIVINFPYHRSAHTRSAADAHDYRRWLLLRSVRACASDAYKVELARERISFYTIIKRALINLYE
jgi:hypothetical protein